MHRPARASSALRTIVVLVLASALSACVGAAGVSSPASPPASVATIASAMPTVQASRSPEPSTTASPSAEPTDDEVEDEGDDAEESPTPRPTPIAGCGTGQSGFFKHIDEVDRMLSFGDSEIELTTAGIGMRDDSYLADDAIPGYIGLSKDEHAVHVGPRDRVRLTGDGMTFPDMAVTFARWSDVEFPKNDLPDLAGPRTEGTTELATDGTMTIVAPDAAGDYYVELGVQWQTTCLKGDGLAYSRIKVN